MTFILEHFDYVLALFLLSIIAFVVNEMYISSKYIKKLHISSNVIKEEECVEARDLLLFHIMKDGSRTGRIMETEEAGCEDLLVLCKSNDLVELIDIAHSVGGQIVLRKVCDQDIENKKYAKIDMKKMMTEMDIARAKRIEKKWR